MLYGYDLKQKQLKKAINDLLDNVEHPLGTVSPYLPNNEYTQLALLRLCEIVDRNI